MKEQQFEQQVYKLRNHHKNIQLQIEQQRKLVQSSDKQHALQKASLISSLTYDLFNYCEDLLHLSQDQSKKCYFLKEKLMKTFEKNKLSTENMKVYEEKLEEAQKKIQSLLAQKQELQLINRNLKAELKLSGVVTSFTFNDNVPSKQCLLNNCQSSISAADPHEESACDTNSEMDKIQLYVSLLSELNNDMSLLEITGNKREVEKQEKILTFMNQCKQNCTKESLNSVAKQNQQIQI